MRTRPKRTEAPPADVIDTRPYSAGVGRGGDCNMRLRRGRLDPAARRAWRPFPTHPWPALLCRSRLTRGLRAMGRNAPQALGFLRIVSQRPLGPPRHGKGPFRGLSP